MSRILKIVFQRCFLTARNTVFLLEPLCPSSGHYTAFSFILLALMWPLKFLIHFWFSGSNSDASSIQTVYGGDF